MASLRAHMQELLAAQAAQHHVIRATGAVDFDSFHLSFSTTCHILMISPITRSSFKLHLPTMLCELSPFPSIVSSIIFHLFPFLSRRN